MLEFEEMPAANDLALIVSLAEKINARVVGLSDKNLPINSKNGPSIQLGFDKFPTELEAFAVSAETLDTMASAFDDELSAEELSALLTS